MKNRLHAFLTHLALSALVAILSLVMVFLVWYPHPLHKAVGVTHIFLLLLTIDNILGPLLTLITYKPTAGFLKFDLPIIVLLQVAALTYGMHTVFIARPAFIVFSQGEFHVIRLLDVDSDSMKKALAEGNQAAAASWLAPKWVAAIPPNDVKRLNEVFFSAVGWNQLPESYKLISAAKEKILAKAKPLAELRASHSQDPDSKTLDLGKDDAVKWLPLRASERDMVVLLDANSADVIKMLDVKP